MCLIHSFFSTHSTAEFLYLYKYIPNQATSTKGCLNLKTTICKLISKWHTSTESQRDVNTYLV